jgi:ABC-type transport system involved in multi-copper enzyme maturation permease subunit
MSGNNIAAIGSIVIKELYRRKDFYVLFILTVLITGMAGSANFFNDDRIVRYLKELSLSLIWLASVIIAITTAARQIPAERESRTIFPLLAKPVTRADVMVGKFAGCWLACGLALVVFYFFFAVVVAARGSSLHPGTCFEAAWLHWMMLGVVVAMTLLGSLVFSSVPANATISLVVVAGLVLLGLHLRQVSVTQPEPVRSLLLALYYGAPQLGFFDTRERLIHNWSLEWGPVVLATLYAWVYTAFFLLAAWLAFRRRALN